MDIRWEFYLNLFCITMNVCQSEKHDASLTDKDFPKALMFAMLLKFDWDWSMK